MKLRPLLVSIALLAPLSAVVWWLGRPSAAAVPVDSRVGQRIADPASLSNAARIELKSDGKTLTFNRTADGRWVLEGSPALPADLTRLARLSNDLVTPKIDRLVSSRAEKIATYELDKTSVIYRDSSGKALFDLRLGKTADGGGRILRIGEETSAYLARLNVSLDTEAASWRDTALLTGLSTNDVASVRIGFSATPQPVVITREKSDQPWVSAATPAGQRVKASLLSTQTGNLTTLRYTNIAPSLDPAVVAARVFPRDVTLTTFSGRTITLTFSRAPEPPAQPPPAVKEGETPPTAPAPAPRPVYVAVADSQANPILVEAAKTHAFEIGEWIYTALPATPADLFEPDPAAKTTDPVSVTTPPLTAPEPSKSNVQP